MKQALILLLLLPLSLLGKDRLSEQATFSLLTCGPGTDLYAAFGHSAIRIHDPIRGINKIYNYGTFDFDTPNFYLKFIRGQLNYKLGVGNFKSFTYSYKHYGRSVVENELQLSPKQQKDLFAFLENNAKAENAYYQYDFFFDNCATRIHDALKEVLADSLVFDDTKLEKKADESYRQLIQPYISHMPWVDFGIDLALGIPTDRKAGFKGRMFLPDHLQTALQKGQLLYGTGSKKPLLGPSKTLLATTVIFPEPPFWTKPSLPFWILACCSLLLAFFIPNKKITRIYTRILSATLGITGLIIFFLMFGTEHAATASNLNILWANPLFLLLAFWPSFKYTFALRRLLFATLLLVIAAWPFWAQDLHHAALPICLSMIFLLLRNGSKINVYS